MYKIEMTNSFKKGLKIASKQHKDIDKMQKVIDDLSTGKKLDPKYKDHQLTGSMKEYRDCHIEPDWVLIYRIYKDKLVLSLTNIGSHQEVFSKHY